MGYWIYVPVLNLTCGRVAPFKKVSQIMTKSKAQKMRAKLGLKGPATSMRRKIVQEVQAIGLSGVVKRKRNRKKKSGSKNSAIPRLLSSTNLGGGTRRLPGGVSMVSDGVNVGSVWKNTTAERVTFPIQREKFADLVSTNAVFEIVSQLYLNPGNRSLFPVFSEIAKNYEEYIPNVLRIYFRTEEYMASGSVVSAGLGAMAVDFDANDADFVSMTQLENYEHSISGAPFSGIMCLDVLEEIAKRKRNGQRGARGKDLSMNNYFVYYSTNSIGPTADQAKFYDLGNFQFALANTQASTAVGELWIEYSFTMVRRKSPESLSNIVSNGTHLEIYSNDATEVAPLGLAPFTNVDATTGSSYTIANMASIGTYNSGTVGLNNAAPSVLNLPNVDGVFLIVGVWSGTATTNAGPAYTAAGGATEVSLWGPAGTGASHAFLDSTFNCASAVFTTTYDGTPNSNTNSITISGQTTMTSGNADIFVCRLPDTLVTMVLSSKEDRLDRLEKMVRRLSLLQDSSDTDDWKCYDNHDTTLSAKNSSVTSSSKFKPTLVKTLNEAGCATSLSDSVVDLIAAKLRK